MPYLYRQSYPNVRASRFRQEATEVQTFERHCHSYYELIYIVKGSGKYIIEGVEYPLHPHALLLIGPYEYHFVCPAPDEIYERVVIHFEKDCLPSSTVLRGLTDNAGGNYFSVKGMDNPVRRAFESMDNIIPLSNGGMGDSEYSETFLRATLTQILCLLTLETPGESSQRDSDIVLRVIEYLNQNLTKDFSLDALAKEFFVSKYHLSRTFHAQTGASIYTYFNTKRIALATQMLRSGESATSVAGRLGFKDYSTFYRAYKKQTGESPIRKIER